MTIEDRYLRLERMEPTAKESYVSCTVNKDKIIRIHVETCERVLTSDENRVQNTTDAKRNCKENIHNNINETKKRNISYGHHDKDLSITIVTFCLKEFNIRNLINRVDNN